MRYYKINNIAHKVYDPEDVIPGRVEVVDNWRNADIGDWVRSDDDCIIQVLRKGQMIKPKGKKRVREYIGTCTGTFIISDNIKMDTSRRNNIYTFGGNKNTEDILVDRSSLTKKEHLFVIYLASGLDAQTAYLKAFPTSNPNYASMQAGKLIKTERIRTAMKEELKPILEDLGVDEKYVLKGIKQEADTAEKADQRLKALFKLSDIMDLEDKNQTKVTQISGAVFKGFIDEDIDKAKRPQEIEHKE